jgi:hypothetical protein
VEHNFTINEVASQIQALYPGLDLIPANFKIRMKDVMTLLPCRIWSHIPLPSLSFQEEIQAFKNQFSF